MRKPDFTGWASKTDVLCTDGTTIRRGCFDQQDGEKVPLCWMHNHDQVGQVLGHAILHSVPGGTRVDGYFNETPGGAEAKELVRNGDIDSLSIWANKLIRKGGDILHGQIKEVSLVIGGADPEARIDSVIAHGEISDDEAEIWGFGAPEFIAHSDKDKDDENDEDEDEDMAKEDTTKKAPATEDDEEESGGGETVKDVFNTLTDKQKKAVAIIVGQIIEEQKSGGSGDDDDDDTDDVKHADYDDEYYDDDEFEHDDGGDGGDAGDAGDDGFGDDSDDGDYDDSDEDEDDSDEEDDEDEDDGEFDESAVADVYDTLSPEQKDAVNYLVGKAMEESEEDSEVKHNVFEEYGYNVEPKQDFISHDDMMQLAQDAKAMGGSLREAFRADVDNGVLAHADEMNGVAGTDYGIGNVEYLFPDARTIDNKPDFIKRNTDWVDGVLSDVHRTPFSRVKSVHANITEDEARARGYIKGHLKKEEVFSLLKRATYPQTVYKKQKLDKDDIDDITDFDVVAWMKTEMQLMLREEIARAILVGDGRLASADDKIKEENIRPVYNDSDLYTIKYPVEIPENATDDQKAKALLRAQLKARKLYKGSGNLTFYTTEDMITNALLLENGIGERMYKSEAEIATAMRVTKVVPVTVMEGLQIEITSEDGTSKQKYDVAGVDVNLVDYNIGTNGGAKTDFFDDFDLDYNQQILLYETRLSGAMVKPFGAITFYFKTVSGKTADTQD